MECALVFLSIFCAKLYHCVCVAVCSLSVYHISIYKVLYIFDKSIHCAMCMLFRSEMTIAFDF